MSKCKICIIFVVCWILMGCGQYGRLYLPREPAKPTHNTIKSDENNFVSPEK